MTPIAPPGPRGGTTLALVAAAAAGTGTLVVEIATVRVAAPWFGQGPYVWANAVGVTLLALTLGAVVGGAWSRRDPRGRALPHVLAGCAAWLAAAAHLAPSLAGWLVPIDVSADRPLPLALWASLVETVLVLGPPVVVLGAVPPLLVARAGGEAGRAAGRISALGTLGALVGCAATSTWLVPALGSRGAIGAAAALAGLAALCAALERVPFDAARAPGAARPGADGTASRALAVAVPLVAGLVVTIVEFAAFRLLTPVSGGTNATFAAAIAAVLLAGAAGAWWGGGAPTGSRDAPRAAVVLAVGIAAALFAPYIGRAVAGFAGPFAGALAAFGPLLFGLGATGPVVVRHRASRGTRAGPAAAGVLAASTLASLLGCYATPLVLLPRVGVRGTCLVAAALAVVVVACVRGLARRGLAPERPDMPSDTPPRHVDGRGAAAAPDAPPARAGRGALGVALAGLSAATVAMLPRSTPLRFDPGQREELETAYQTVRAIEADEAMPVPGARPLFGDTRQVTTRYLRFDEDASSYQSVRLAVDEATLLTGGRYYDHLALGAWLEGQPWTRADGRDLAVLVVGYCGGTLHRVLAATAPADRGLDVVGVELDPAVATLAARHLGAFPARGTIHTGRDARRVVDELPATPTFDLVLVDAYQRTQYVPFQLATREFFAAVARRTKPGGAVIVNVNAPDGLRGRLLDAIASTMAAGLGDGTAVWLVPNVQYPSSAAVLALPGRATPPRLAADVPASLTVPAYTFERFLVRATRPGLVLTDDRAPVEELADEAMLPVETTR